MTRKFVLTGGPGIGKTTVLQELSNRGFYTIGESATYIIERELRQDGDVVPWKNLYEFQRKVLENQEKWEREIPKEKDIAFLDRGIYDGLAYVINGDILIPPELIQNRNEQYAGIFILDPLEGIHNTIVRKETKEQQQKIHALIREVYEQKGYNPMIVPVLTPKERAEWILKRI